MPYKNQIFPTVQTDIAYDNLEFTFDGTGALSSANEFYLPLCGVGGGRYLQYNWGSSNGWHYNDMKVDPLSKNQSSQSATYLFGVNANHVFTKMCVVVGTTENWATSAAGANDPTATGRGDKVLVPGNGISTVVILNYGAYNPGVSTHFFYSRVTLATLGWVMPADGTGGYQMLCADLDANNAIIDSKDMMPGEWGIKASNPAAPSDVFSWDDDGGFDANFNTLGADGQFTDGTGGSANEFYDDTFTCPPELSPCMMFFYTKPAQPAVLAPTSTNVLFGAIQSGDNSSLSGDDGNVLKICKFFVPTLASPKIRFDSDFLSPYLTPTAVSLSLKAAMTTAGQFKVRAFIADRNAGGPGTFTYGAANQVVADTTITLTQTTFSGSSTNVANNVYTDGTMRSRVEIQQTGFSAVLAPCTAFELLNITVTP